MLPDIRAERLLAALKLIPDDLVEAAPAPSPLKVVAHAAQAVVAAVLAFIKI